MMRLQKYLTTLSLLLVLVTTSGCSIFGRTPEKEIVVQTKLVERNIPIQAAPRPLTMSDVSWYVVTEENFDEFIEKYEKEHGKPWVFYAISVRGYEAMALNMAEIRRYVEQQKQIILYYEEAVTPKGVEDNDSPDGETGG